VSGSFVVVRALVVGTLGVAVLAGGCGGSSSGSASASATGSSSPSVAATSLVAVPSPATPRVPKSYTNPFGFTVTYDNAVLRQLFGREVATSDRFGITPGGQAYRATRVGLTGFVDKGASKVVSSATDAGDVTVIGWLATSAVTKPTLAELQSAPYLFWHGQRTPAVSLIDKADGPTQIEQATIGGLKGFCAVQHATGRTNVAYLLFDGDRLYTIKYQAKDAHWAKLGPVLETVAQSLHVAGSSSQ